MNVDQFKFDEGVWITRIDNEYDLYIAGCELEVDGKYLNLSSDALDKFTST